MAARGRSRGRPSAAERRNEERRERYREDSEYHDLVAARSLESYRRRVHGTTELENPVRDNVGRVSRFGVRARVGGRNATVFPMANMAKLLCRSRDGLRRWVADGMLPAPRLTLNGIAVYSLEEAKAVTAVLADHFDAFAYYRRNHRETRDRLWEQFRAAGSKGRARR